jgi:hypothetical protein
MSIEDFLKNPKTVEIILSSLGLETTLPNEGFIAGGSVANMLLSLYHLGTPRKFNINDIDIFNTVDPNTIDKKQLDGEGETLLMGDVHLGMGIAVDEGYGHVYVERDGTFYRVMKSERDGIINNISCFVSHGQLGSKHTTPNYDPDNDIILRGFDLNCCQAGIDLKNGVLHYTESFKNFLKSKQVLVDIPYTPLHSAIRLIKKMVMYGDFCYCDIDYEMKYLQQATKSGEACMFIAKENYDKFIDNHEALQDYIEVTSVDIKNMPHEYRKMYFPNSFKVINKPMGNNMTSTPVGRGNYVETEMIEGRELWTYEFTKKLDRIPESFDKMWELKKIWDFRYRSRKKSHQNKIDMIMNFSTEKKKKVTNLANLLRNEEGDKILAYPLQCLMSNDFYYDCDFTEEHLGEISVFVGEHRGLAGMLSKTNNIQEQYNNVKMLKTLAKQEGNWVIGTLETLGFNEVMKGTEITKEWVQGLIDKEKLRMSLPLVEPLNIDNFKYKECVTELITPLDLQAEGKKLGHCVGGYSYNIEKGESRIFSVNVGGIQSTLEIGLKDYNYNFSIELGKMGDAPKPKKSISVKQHSGRYPEVMGNRTPTNKCRGVGMKLVYHLAKQELSDSEFKELFELRDVKTYNNNNFGINEKTIKRNGWSKLLNDNHRGKNSVNKNSKKKDGNFINDVLDF